MSREGRTTLRDVAEAAGVSVATCSYVLSGRADRTTPLPEPTRRRVEEAAGRLGYKGNTAARSLRRQRSELVAIVYAPPVGPWLDHLTAQSEDIAAAHGYSVIGVPVRRLDRAAQSLRVITRGHVDGAIFVGGLSDELDLTAARRSTRALMAFSDTLEMPGVDVVRNNARTALAEATTYLIDAGRTRIAFLSHTGAQEDRYLGYVDALRRAGREVDPGLVRIGAAAREDAVLVVRELLDAPNPPDAIVSESDRGGFAALQAAVDRGVKVPDDLAVIGTGNTREASYSQPPLTSVGMHQLDFTEMVEALFARIDDPTLPARELNMSWVLNHRASA
ncbi:DNA-binding LacI/PurR family transcriptional regulator [Kribbella pratensis]|jgi:DNA-binding LacI/PurR family transcriptional regulator|uniref:DNA-binding LacI/PurR family transcriptional regulator n=1 Tax=Kribbella pratensis TaxID=2512112 RepID=A0ABY2FB69_9ACTN|nr:LacI family DNA-binding transcriptional regulator [Kribbella pratensis]TDW87842.1 DNA-binding LacI/PurR family transcriptional regulator [Kribbella pratensis]